jgi:hypothetical protein
MLRINRLDKSIVDSLEGTVVWEYDSMVCPQTIVRLYRGMMKACVNQTNTYEGSTVVVEHQDRPYTAMMWSLLGTRWGASGTAVTRY